jgi:hypothetical protein
MTNAGRLFDGILLLRLSARQQSQRHPKRKQAGIRHGLHLFSVQIVRGKGSLYARFPILNAAVKNPASDNRALCSLGRFVG